MQGLLIRDISNHLHTEREVIIIRKDSIMTLKYFEVRSIILYIVSSFFFNTLKSLLSIKKKEKKKRKERAYWGNPYKLI